jgi:hypothetical protein
MIGALEEAYRAALEAFPSSGTSTIFGRFLLICDKSMRTAAMLVAGCQPEDSVGVTRRALECAKTALAIKLNDTNVANWLSQEERLARWAARKEGKKPKSFRVDLESVKGDPLIDQLGDMIGVLSDASVHFTPEFYSNLAWEVRIREDSPTGHIFLNYFHTSDREIERAFLSLYAAHGLILNAFDRCTDGKLSENARFKERVSVFWQVSKQFSDAYRERYPNADGGEIT